MKKNKNRKRLTILLTIMLLCGGCAHNLKVEKFPTYIDTDIYSTEPLQIIIPENEPLLIVENLNIFAAKGTTLQVDINHINRNAKEFITDYLSNQNITVTDCDKTIKFQITKIQYETWGDHIFVTLQGCFLYFTIETSSGYKKEYKVQDQSGWNFERAMGGAVSRAVEKMFDDPNIIKFISEA
jgi:hypothetical protein